MSESGASSTNSGRKWYHYIGILTNSIVPSDPLFCLYLVDHVPRHNHNRTNASYCPHPHAYHHHYHHYHIHTTPRTINTANTSAKAATATAATTLPPLQLPL
mgnify:CR=1 FL=1